MRSDVELLEEYRKARSETAFAEIVSRHSRLVFHTCLRVARGNPGEAEDATQATFMMLARAPEKVDRILATWLHNMALRIAWNAARGRIRRRKREQAVGRQREMENVMDSDEAEVAVELRKDLDGALLHLPESLREAVVLLYMEGRTQEEAAAIAGCPRGTLSSRAVRGLDKLRSLLAGRGAGVGAAVLTAFLAQEGGSVSAAEVASITKAALGGAESARAELLLNATMKAMAWTKVKAWASVLVAASAVVGATAPLVSVMIRPTAESFETLSAMIRPHADESRWTDIPWTQDSREARRRAAAEGKPLFVWSMTGFALGTSGVMSVRREFEDPMILDFARNQCVPLVVGGGNTAYLASPTGKLIHGLINELPQQGMEAYRSLPDSDRRPETLEPVAWEEGKQYPVPPGALVAREYIRRLERDPAGRLRRSEEDSKLYAGPNRDFLWIPEGEWKSLAQGTVPESLKTRILCYHLHASADGIRPLWERHHLKGGDVTLTVREKTETGVLLHARASARLAGNFNEREQGSIDFEKADWKADFRLEGFLYYDLSARRFTRFDLAGVGDYQDPITGPIVLGIAFELASPSSLGYGTPPFMFRLDESTRKYFGAE